MLRMDTQQPRLFEYLESDLDGLVTSVLASPVFVTVPVGPVPVCVGGRQVCVGAGSVERRNGSGGWPTSFIPSSSSRPRQGAVPEVAGFGSSHPLGADGRRRHGGGPGGDPGPLHLDRGRGRRGPAPASRPGPGDGCPGVRGERGPAAGQGAAAPEHRHEARRHGGVEQSLPDASIGGTGGLSRAETTPPSVDIASTLRSLGTTGRHPVRQVHPARGLLQGPAGSSLASTPSVWPVRGYLSAGFGNRPDPFTGQRTSTRASTSRCRSERRCSPPRTVSWCRAASRRATGTPW